jgi:hypothetical protein
MVDAEDYPDEAEWFAVEYVAAWAPGRHFSRTHEIIDGPMRMGMFAKLVRDSVDFLRASDHPWVVTDGGTLIRAEQIVRFTVRPLRGKPEELPFGFERMVADTDSN